MLIQASFVLIGSDNWIYSDKIFWQVLNKKNGYKNLLTKLTVNVYFLMQKKILLL